MISKSEYIFLYEKFLKGECTPHELALLDAYQDDIDLKDRVIGVPPINEDVVKQRIWQRMQAHIKTPANRNLNKLTWLRAAAILVITLSAGLVLFKYQQVKRNGNRLSGNHKTGSEIKPGGNNAYLTMADGTVISLNAAGNGALALRSGIQISKAKDGMVVYKFVNQGKNKSATNAINTITTPRGGQYQIQLSDGTLVWLNAESSLKFPVTFSEGHRDVELAGEAYFEVTKNKHQPFTVQANGTKVQVLGTHFNVSAYANDASVSTTLLEGSVKMVKQNTEVMLKPGQNGITEKGETGIKVQPADLEQETAWKNGFIIFNNANIKAIMKQASRWYNVDVVYEGNVSDQLYNGKISKYQDISELLTNIELTGTLHFKVDGRRVTVMK